MFFFYHTAHSPKHTYRLIRQRFSDGATGLWPIFRMQRYALFLYLPNISAKNFVLFFEAFRPGESGGTNSPKLRLYKAAAETPDAFNPQQRQRNSGNAIQHPEKVQMIVMYNHVTPHLLPIQIII